MALPSKTCRVCGADYARGEAFCPVDGGRLSSASELERPVGDDSIIGSTLDGRYRVLRVIGEGGMGIVYEAEHVMIDKPVAVKVLRDDFTRRPDVVQRFRQEAKSASRIGHPNIIDVSDFGETPSGASYFVMEMLKGEDMADLLAREYVLSPLRAVGIVYQVCKALSVAHRLGIIHRDLKPENLFVMEKDGHSDFIKIVDFGVAKMTDIELGGSGRKLTTTGMIFGTPEYMSPEQARGGDLDHRVDVYATGIILYELVTGRVPFEGDNFMEILNKHGQDPVPPLQQLNPATRVSEALQGVIMRALRKDPTERFGDMEEMAQALQRCTEMPSMVPSDSVLPPDWSTTAPPPPPRTKQQQPVAVPADEPASLSPSEFEPGDESTLAAQLRMGPLRKSAAIAAALVLGAAAALTLPRDGPTEAVVSAEDPAAPVPAAVVPEVVSAVSVPPQQPAATGQPPTDAPATVAPATPGADALVDVHVVTQPAGARISIRGEGVVCDASPCQLQLPQGQSIRLSARRGVMQASAEIVPDGETEVHMALRRTQNTSKPRARTSPVVAAELKVPEMFR